MPTYFLDSSALLKRYVQEAGTDRILELVTGDARLCVSRLAFVEVTSAVVRRGRQRFVPGEWTESILAALESEFRERFEVVELGTSVVTRAADLTRTHGLRAADAIQLACALIARGEGTADAGLILVSSDQELNAAAEAEELRVLDPTVS